MVFKGWRLTAGRRPTRGEGGRFWVDVGPRCWPILGLCWPGLGLYWQCGRNVEPSWGYIGPAWGYVGPTYLSQILTFFVLKSGEDKKERITLMKSRALRSLDFIRIFLSSSSLLLVRGPAVTTVIYLAKLIQTNSRYAWFEIMSDARASQDA